jgi:AraC-like DNA-binding protein
MDREITRRGDPELIDRLDFEAMDKPEELMAEACGIGVVQARRALAWMREQDEDQHDHDLADTILRVLTLLLPKNNTLNGFLIGVRAVALSWLLRPEGESMTAIAGRLGISKQLFSHHVREMESTTGLHAAAQKAPQTIAVYAEAARQRWKELDATQRRARRNSKSYRKHIAEMAAQAGMTLEQALEVSTPTATETHDDQRSNLTGVEG